MLRMSDSRFGLKFLALLLWARPRVYRAVQDWALLQGIRVAQLHLQSRAPSSNPMRFSSILVYFGRGVDSALSLLYGGSLLGDLQ